MALSNENEALTGLRALAPDGQHVKYLRQACMLAAVGATEAQVRAFARRVARGQEVGDYGEDLGEAE